MYRRKRAGSFKFWCKENDEFSRKKEGTPAGRTRNTKRHIKSKKE
jgi:hypothetical protein